MGLKPRPSFRWDLSDPETYPIIDVLATTPRGITSSLAHWWAKIAELAAGSEMWNTVVGDIWLDSGRIIGHVQMRDVAVGYDTGFRVAAHVGHIADELFRADFSDRSWSDMTVLLTRCALDALELEPARSAMATLRESRPFEVEIASFGQWQS